MGYTDTSEGGLERLICAALTGDRCDPPRGETTGEPPASYGGAGWVPGNPYDYDREYCVDTVQLNSFLSETQPEIADALLLNYDGPTRRAFLARLQGEISKRGIIDVLRNGVKHGAHSLELFYGTPSAENEKARELFEQNRFSVTRQLRYSRDETQLALDIVLFINGLPVFTFELKNQLTKQTVGDAVKQYQRDRSPREKLFALGRCIAHFALDDSEAHFCTHLQGEDSLFLPFNKGYNDGAGNPPNPDGMKTDYLWNEILTRESLTDIIENYAQMIELKDEKSGGKSSKKKRQVFPRYHQLDVVRKLLNTVRQQGVGHRYLIQHSAGSGKSNSIAWLARQLIGLEREDERVFDSIIVITDRRILDKQINATITNFSQVKATIGHADRSVDLRKFIEEGKKIIISTVQKFPLILDEIGNEQRGHNFAIIIDEAHSSQGGRTSMAISQALSIAGEVDEEESDEDKINRLMESRKLLPNASYFAFTATPKNKTLEIFGEAERQADGKRKPQAFHNYSMKQAIEEGFIMDVLKNYTPVASYYNIAKTIPDDPKYDVKKALKKIRNYVEKHEHAIRYKAEIMVDHFHEQVAGTRRIDGQARAMVVTNGVENAIRYFHAIRDYLEERKSQYKPIVAFSGEHEYAGDRVSEASLNGFPSTQIADKFKEEPYRFLICADKFQTGYDEPLLHTMYVDKTLAGIKAVQTLSRLNRSAPGKHDTFVLDFKNDVDTIRKSFEPYYIGTILAEETDPNKLHDLQYGLDQARVYSSEQVDDLVTRYLDGAGREQLDPILDACVAVYLEQLDEDEQVEFKGNAKMFIRIYGFLSAVLPYNNADWERRSIFLNFLVSKLPSPKSDDLSRGVLDAIDMDSYRAEKQATQRIVLADEVGEIDPVPLGSGVGKPEPEMVTLSSIIKDFNEQFGGVTWNDRDRVLKFITEDIPDRIAADSAYQNARENSDEQNARVEFKVALRRVMVDMLNDDTELYKQFADNPNFKQWLTNALFLLTYKPKPRTAP